MTRLLPLALALFPAGLMAQEMQIDTASGPAALLPVTVDGFTQHMLDLGGQRFVLPDSRYAEFAGLYGSLLLVQVSGGGNACPAQFLWVHTAPGEVKLTAPFGTCSEGFEISTTAEEVIVTQASMVPGVDRVQFIYDGHSLREAPVGPAASGIAADAGADVWIGRYPGDLLAAAEWREALVAVLGQEGLTELSGVMTLQTPFEVDGEWVFGAGCDKIDCGVVDGAIAVNRRDGRIIAATNIAGDTRVWGELGPNPPEGLFRIIPRAN